MRTMTKPRSARPTHAPFRCLVWERWASSHKTAHPLDLLCAKPNASRVPAIRTQTRAILWLQNQRVDTLALSAPRLSLECKFETICILRALFIFILSKIFLAGFLAVPFLKPHKHALSSCTRNTSFVNRNCSCKNELHLQIHYM